MKKNIWALVLVMFIFGIAYFGDSSEEKPFFESPEYYNPHPLSMFSQAVKFLNL